MKKLISLLICSSLVLTSCASSKKKDVNDSNASDNAISTSISNADSNNSVTTIDYSLSYSDEDIANSFSSVYDDELLSYMEDVVYYDLVSDLDSSEYYVEGIQATYVSQEYIEEVTYNSQENVYFGFHLSDIKEAFGDTPCFFTVDENGEVVVTEYTYKEFEFSFASMLKDITIGTGVIIVCATVALLTAPTMPAFSAIMMVSAKSAAAFALTSGALGATSSGLVTYIQTGDINQSLQAAMDGGGKGYKIGAITGAVAGAGKEIAFLKKATSTKYLTWDEAAMIQRESKYPAEVIAQIHNMDEYRALAKANLKPMMVGGKTALVPESFNKNLIDSKGRTNLQRMQAGLAPIDENGISYELHHIGQEADATLAMLTRSQHDNIALHGFKKISEVPHDAGWDAQRKRFYKSLYDYLSKNA